MAEQPAIVAKINWAAAYDHEYRGRGLTTGHIVNAMRDYFNDTSIPHYWEVDTTTPGGSYNMTTNASPLDTSSIKHATLVLKPKAGAPGGTQQRIVFITRGSNVFGVVGWGALLIGYLPDGVFDPSDGVNTNNPANINDIELLTTPTSFSSFRNLSGNSTFWNNLDSSFHVVEYRDDPSKFSDPAQSLFLSYESKITYDDFDRTGLRPRRLMQSALNEWISGCLVGRILQPFTRYHELAVGNKGDGIWTGQIGNRANLGERPTLEAGYSTASAGYRDHSSLNRVAPNVWAFAWPFTFASRTGAFTYADNYSYSPDDYPVLRPIGQGAGNSYGVVDGIKSYALQDFGVYATCKYVKQLGTDLAGGAAGLIYESKDPASTRAWYSPPNGFLGSTWHQSRYLLWNKSGATSLNYYQV